MFSLKKKNLKRLDKKLLVTLLLLVTFGLITLYTTTYSLDGNYMKTQIISTILGFILILIILPLDLQFIKKLHIPIYIFCIAILYLVLIFGVGDSWGARSSFLIGPIYFQPAELAKIGFILSYARVVEINQSKLNEPFTLLRLLVLAAIPVYLVLRQPDTGTSIVFMFFSMAMLFVAGLDFRYIIISILAVLAAIPVTYFNLKEFQKNRIRNFLDPTRDLSGSGLQAWRGRIAIGSGKMTGQGFLKGTQGQFNFIPEKHTDFIYPVLVEEFGFIGGFICIFLFGYLIYRSIIIAKETKSLYSRLVVIGFTALILFHVFENIGMTLGVMPITGIPLPFFSYGGTFQITNLIGMGFILSISMEREPLSFF